MQETTRLVAPIRRCAQILLLSLGLLTVCASLASAQATQDAPGDTWGDKRQPENYVQSKGPAEEGHTYNWLQMGYAGIVMAGMVVFLVWLVRRTPGKSRSDVPDKLE